MATRGGAREGAGRKAKAEEMKVATQAVNSIISKYGSAEEGFKALLDSKEPSLIKWVFEHAYGKPQDRIDVTSKGNEINAITQVEIIRTNENQGDG